jgi:ribosomal protein S18 acetylase RimI-like enzyme
MDLNWQIREAVPEDAIELKKCMASAYITYQVRLGGVRLPPIDADYLSEIKNYPTWIVETPSGVVGGLIMMFENNQASIANIAIDPAYQGRGIGGALMKFAESRAIEKGYSELQLATHVLLNENISLYLYLGWEESGRDETRVLMKKIL